MEQNVQLIIVEHNQCIVPQSIVPQSIVQNTNKQKVTLHHMFPLTQQQKNILKHGSIKMQFIR